MTHADILNLVQRELVEAPIIEKLGLTDDHFHGAVVSAGEKLSSGRAEEALADYANLVLISPQSVAFQIGLADAAVQCGQLELALQAASFVISTAPNRPEGFLLSGKACLAMGEIELAREDLNDALTRAASKPEYKAVTQAARQCLAMISET